MPLSAPSSAIERKTSLAWSDLSNRASHGEANVDGQIPWVVAGDGTYLSCPAPTSKLCTFFRSWGELADWSGRSWRGSRVDGHAASASENTVELQLTSCTGGAHAEQAFRAAYRNVY